LNPLKTVKKFADNKKKAAGVPPIKVPPPPIDLAQNSVRTENGSVIGGGAPDMVTQAIWNNKRTSDSPSPRSNNNQETSKGGGYFGKVAPSPAHSNNSPSKRR